MPTLQFMPWCHIDKTYSVGEITLIPFECDKSSERLDELTNRQVKTILASYKNLEGMSVRKATLVQYEDRPLLADLGDDELEVTRENVELACFCGLAKREYFRPGLYCNTDCFVLYGHKFSQEPDFVAITSRRGDGRTDIGRLLATTVFSIPVHVSAIAEVSLDAELLDALVAFKQTSNDEWSRWQNAIACFNQANTDNPAFRYQVEWVLLCSAFQRILRAGSDARDVAQKFTNTMVPYTTLEVRQAKRRASQMRDESKPFRYEWMREFYRIRGDFAHGKLKTHQQAAWKPLEHVVLARIAFPLLVRCLLKGAGRYVLTDDDLAQIGAFEKLADEQFLEPPADQKHSIDWIWPRLLEQARSDLVTQKALADPEIRRLFGEESES